MAIKKLTNNVGNKIKSALIILFILSLIGGRIPRLLRSGLINLLAYVLYGFGDIVENVAMIKQKMYSEADSKDNSKDNSAAVNEDEDFCIGV